MAKQGAGGRPSKYRKKYCKLIEEYFTREHSTRFLKKEIIRSNGTVEREYTETAAVMPKFEDFAASIGVTDSTIVNWANAKKKNGKPKYPEFLAAYTRAKELQKGFLINLGLSGLAPPASFIFVASNVTDMRSKQHLDVTSDDEPITGVAILPPPPDTKKLGDGKDNEPSTTG